MDWFKFSLLTDGGVTDKLQLTGSGPGALPLMQLTDGAGSDSLTATNGLIQDLHTLKAGQEYFLKISGAAAARYQINASVGTARKAALDFSATELENLSSNVLILRRDVILGGAGNDVLSGGSGEEWIFGGALEMTCWPVALTGRPVTC